MPELPEVETVRRAIEPLIVGRRVITSELLRRDVLVAPGDPAGGFSRQRSRKAQPSHIQPHDLLEGLTVREVTRRGKHLAIIAKGGGTYRALVVQLGMSGTMRFSADGRNAKPHTHAKWTFEHGVLEFIDPRRFGGLRVFRAPEQLDAHFAALGPDALSISQDDLAARIAGSRRFIKAVLLDQAVLAGVGNIYADEALFLAGINPKKLASALKLADLERLAKALRRVLSDAVKKGGSTLRDFHDPAGEPGNFQNDHRVYGRSGQPCRHCGKTLASAVIAQRTTVWCPHCQPLRRNAKAALT